MADKIKAKKKFFKRTWVLVLLIAVAVIALFAVVLIVTVMVGKKQAAGNPTPPPHITASPSPVPSPTPIPQRNYDMGETLSFDPDLTAMDLPASVLESYEGSDLLGGAYWADVTTPELRELDAVMIRHGQLDYTYLIYEDVYYRLGQGLGGYGLIDSVVCDLNYDDSPELLYTYSYGNQSEYTCGVAWFDFESKAIVEAPFWVLRDNLAIEQTDGSCFLYHARREKGNSEGGYVLYVGEPIGEIIESQGELVLILDTAVTE